MDCRLHETVRSARRCLPCPYLLGNRCSLGADEAGVKDWGHKCIYKHAHTHLDIPQQVVPKKVSSQCKLGRLVWVGIGLELI